MNISSVVVKTAPEHFDEVMETLRASGLCEIHFTDETGKIVVTLEGKDTDDEIGKMREIMNLPNVLCAGLAYSCSESRTALGLCRFERNRDAVPDALKSLPADL
jgi:nitrate reductase NapD